MLIEFFTGCFVILCLMIVFLIFLQKGKGSMGLGSMGGGTQMLFGGGGGQDMFQKTTWVLIALFLTGSLGLALYKSHVVKSSFIHYNMPESY